MGLKSIKFSLIILLLTLVTVTTSCQKKTSANFSPTKNNSRVKHKKPTKKDLNDCHIMEKQRDIKEAKTNTTARRIAKRNKKEASWEARGKTVKLERKRKKRQENEDLYGPGYATDWSFIFTIGIALALVIGGAIFLVSLAVTFIISLALSTFLVPFAFAILGFVFSAFTMGAFHLFNAIKNIFQRRRRRRKKKKEEEELNQEQYSNEL